MAAPSSLPSSFSLIHLPPECLVEILAFLAPRSLCTARLVCRDLAAVSLWPELCERTWGVRPPEALARSTFIARYTALCGIRAARLVHESHWLALDSAVAVYTGVGDDAHGIRSVGVANTVDPLPAWPFGGPLRISEGGGAGAGVEVSYFEVDVLDAGEHGFIGVGWSREGYSQHCKQPGWERHTYGWHGDDGRAYSASGWGRPFGPSFGQGAVVGTGLVVETRHAAAASAVDSRQPDGAVPSSAAQQPPRPPEVRGRVFFTLNGALVGCPFEDVQLPHLLRPAVGLHSERETVRVRFGWPPEADAAGERAEGSELPPVDVQASEAGPAAAKPALAAEELDPAKLTPDFRFDLRSFVGELSSQAVARELARAQRLRTGAGNTAAQRPGESSGLLAETQPQLLQHAGLGSGSEPSGSESSDDEDEDEEDDAGEAEGGYDLEYAQLFERIADPTDVSEETRQELIRFLRANIVMQMPPHHFDEHSVEDLRHICQFFVSEMANAAEDESGEEEEGEDEV